MMGVPGAPVNHPIHRLLFRPFNFFFLKNYRIKGRFLTVISRSFLESGQKMELDHTPQLAQVQKASPVFWPALIDVHRGLSSHAWIGYLGYALRMFLSGLPSAFFPVSSFFGVPPVAKLAVLIWKKVFLSAKGILDAAKQKILFQKTVD